MDQIEIDGIQITYERAGEGPPLFLLHGYVGDGRVTWRRQLEDLSDEYTVVAWDMPGTGRSSDPPESFTLADFADCLARFVQALGFDRAHVAGLSFGGGLALQLFERHPEIPMTLTLAGAYAGWAGSLPAEEVERRLQQVLDLADVSTDVFVSAVGPTMFSSPVPPELADPFIDSVAEFHPSGLRTLARAFAEADLRPILPRVDVPTLLLHGERDVRAPLSVVEALHTGIPTSKLVILPGVGHASCLESPDRFTAEVRAFLRSETAASA